MGIKGFIKNKIIMPLIIKELLKYINGPLRKEINMKINGKGTKITAVLGGIVAVANLAIKFINGEAVAIDDFMYVLAAFGLYRVRVAIDGVGKQ